MTTDEPPVPDDPPSSPNPRPAESADAEDARSRNPVSEDTEWGTAGESPFAHLAGPGTRPAANPFGHLAPPSRPGTGAESPFAHLAKPAGERPDAATSPFAHLTGAGRTAAPEGAEPSTPQGDESSAPESSAPEPSAPEPSAPEPSASEPSASGGTEPSAPEGREPPAAGSSAPWDERSASQAGEPSVSPSSGTGAEASSPVEPGAAGAGPFEHLRSAEEEARHGGAENPFGHLAPRGGASFGAGGRAQRGGGTRKRPGERRASSARRKAGDHDRTRDSAGSETGDLDESQGRSAAASRAEPESRSPARNRAGDEPPVSKRADGESTFGEQADGDPQGERTPPRDAARRRGARSQRDAGPQGSAGTQGDVGRQGDGGRRGGRGTGGRAAPADPEARAREICLRLLAAAPRTRAQLADALRRKDVGDDVAERVLGRFTDVGLIDDKAFAQAWVRSRHAGRGLARRALAAELRRRGVDSETVGEAVEELDPDEEARTARALVDRKLRTTRDVDPVKRTRRLVGMLARKGYPPGTAYRVVREALEAEGADVPDGLDHLD
jgi:regulatory protein